MMIAVMTMMQGSTEDNEWLWWDNDDKQNNNKDNRIKVMITNTNQHYRDGQDGREKENNEDSGDHGGGGGGDSHCGDDIDKQEDNANKWTMNMPYHNGTWQSGWI